MANIQVKIIFPTILGVNQFETQTINLGGVFPEIEVKLVDKTNGLHEFSITKILPHGHPSMVLPAIAEADDQINLFWDILSYVRDSTIKSTGEVFYEINGTRHLANPKPISISARLNGVAGKGWFEANIEDFHKMYDLDLLKRYNFCRTIDEPVAKFISLYSLLSSVANENQENIDALIEKVDPNVGKYLPQGRRMETTYTRLRNELAHVRKGTSTMKTHAEISLHLPRFEWIVKELLRKRIILE